MCMPLLFSHTLVFIICSVILTITLAFFGFMLHLTIQVLSHQGSHSVYVSVHIPEFGWLPSLWLLLQYSAIHLSMFILFNELLFFSFMLPVSICSPDKPYIVIIIFTFITITSIIAEHCNFYCVTIASGNVQCYWFVLCHAVCNYLVPIAYCNPIVVYKRASIWPKPVAYCCFKICI